MGFYGQEELLRLLNSCDLYVHASDAEIEGISCMEALACGLVPVIANSPLSATPQFALDDRSLFQAGNAGDLADKIDYWIEHPEERAAQGRAYAARGTRCGWTPAWPGQRTCTGKPSTTAAFMATSRPGRAGCAA